LPEARRLRIIFPHPEPADETLHIFIRVPSTSECSSHLAPLIAHRFHSVPPPGLPSVPILELNCFVHGDDPRNVFPVKIAITESVGTLKDAIKDKKKPVFDRLAADALKLWKVSIPFHADSKEKVSNVQFRDEKELSPVDRLSKIFSVQPGERDLHIIVVCDPPTGECECFVEFDESDHLCIGYVRLLQRITSPWRDLAIRSETGEAEIPSMYGSIVSAIYCLINPLPNSCTVASGACWIFVLRLLFLIIECSRGRSTKPYTWNRRVPLVFIFFSRLTYLIADNTRQCEDVTSNIMEQWLPNVTALPQVQNLLRFLDKPFPDHAKIPLDRYRFESLISNPSQLSDRLQRQDLEQLFRIHDRERAEGLYARFYAVLMDDPPDNDGTESAFHSFWDGNIRKVMEALIPDGVSIRDSNRHTNTHSQRPDFGFLYLTVCPFRGEEKSPTNITDDPKAELRVKMLWVYDPSPYILGEPQRLITLIVLTCAPKDITQPELW
jgi:hypothetical protein